jgi:hypothetical protein
MIQLRVKFDARSLVEGIVVVDYREDHQYYQHDECDDSPRKQSADE